MGKLVKIMSMNVDSQDSSGTKVFKEVWLNPDKVTAVYPWYAYHISPTENGGSNKSVCNMGSIIEIDSPMLSYDVWHNTTKTVARIMFVPYNVESTVRILHDEIELKNAAVIECPFPMNEMTSAMYIF